MARVLSLALLALAPVDAGDAVKTGTVASETGELFLCASTQLQHADMLYRVDVSGSEMKVTASLEMPADADKDGWKKSVCGAAPASVAADGTLYWALDAMYTENNPVGPSILAVQSDVEPFAGLRVASRTVLPVACDLARVNYCNANGLVVDGDTLWVGVNEYLVSYDLPLTDDSKPATSEKYAAGGWGCPAGYLTSLKSLTVHGGKLYGVATCDGDAPAATNLVVRFHKKGAPEAWATFPNSDGGVLDELLSDGADLLVVGTGDGRYAQVPPALFRVADGSGAANLTVVEDLQLSTNAFIADLGGVASLGGTSLIATGQSCTPAPPPPERVSAADAADLPPYCPYKTEPKNLIAHVTGGAVDGVLDLSAYKLFTDDGLVYAVAANDGGELLVRYNATGTDLAELAKIELPVVPIPGGL